jgi:zinc finger homeobox protein 4
MDSFLQQSHSSVKGMPQMVPSLEQAQSGLASNAGHLPGAALADLAYNQALLIQLLHQNSVGINNANAPGFMSLLQQQQQQQAQSNQQSQLHYQQINGTTNQDIDQGLNPETLEPPFEQDFNPIYNYSCLICSNFNSNDLEELNNHINEDRSRLSFPQEFIVVVNNNNYTCRLCCYKTHLKANCQLHCKTDKHLQRVNFANHIKQGSYAKEIHFSLINLFATSQAVSVTSINLNTSSTQPPPTITTTSPS